LESSPMSIRVTKARLDFSGNSYYSTKKANECI
jgi:hypothetical protein